MENNNVTVKFKPILDSEGNPEILGSIMVLQATDAKTGEDLGVISRLGLDGTLGRVADEDSEIRERLVKCSDELSAIIADIFNML